MKKGLNYQNIKTSNRSNILYLLNDHSQLSRTMIASYLGLTKAAVSKIIQQLLLEGVVKEVGEVGSGVGRKEVMLELNLSSKIALGITFERDEITFSLSSLNGELKDLYNIPFDNDFFKVKEKIKEYYIDKKNKFDIIAIGISIIGHKHDYGVYKNIDIEKELSEFISLPIYVKNNVQAFSLAELIYGNKTRDKNVLIFKWGPGIGSSFIRDGKVLSGDDFGVTEIGHVIVNTSGKNCRCGRIGCLETEAALDVIEEDIKKLGYNISIDEILDSDDKKILSIIDKKIDMVCLALLNACTIINSTHIIIFGSFFKSEKFLKRFLNKWERISSPLKTNMVLSKLNSKSDYIGSTAIVARKLFFEKYM